MSRFHRGTLTLVFLAVLLAVFTSTVDGQTRDTRRRGQGGARLPANAPFPRQSRRLSPQSAFIKSYDGLARDTNFRRLRFKRSPQFESNPFGPNPFQDPGTASKGPHHDVPASYDYRYGKAAKAVDDDDPTVSKNNGYKVERPNRKEPPTALAQSGAVDLFKAFAALFGLQGDRYRKREPNYDENEVLTAETESNNGHKSRRVAHGSHPEHSTSHHHDKDFFYYALDVAGHHGGSRSLDPLRPWNVDCNGRDFGDRDAFIVGIWDDGDDFRDLDRVKCAGSKDRHDGYMLDLWHQKMIDLTPESYRYTPVCDKGFVLTAFWDDDDNFRHVMLGKCARVENGHVDNKHCNNFYTKYKDNGPGDASKKWLVQCPRGWAAVGIKRDRHRIDHLRCCRLVKP